MANPNKASLETVLKAVVSLSERVDALPTKLESMIDAAKEELLQEMRPMSRALDKDAVTLINHEK
ncbi:MAG: hypothetical protein AAB927_00250, partial [Patescibacteria group bacterium]